MNWKGRLGVPYQGSKNAIAKDIIGILPRGKRFVDLFAGPLSASPAQASPPSQPEAKQVSVLTPDPNEVTPPDGGHHLSTV